MISQSNYKKTKTHPVKSRKYYIFVLIFFLIITFLFSFNCARAQFLSNKDTTNWSIAGIEKANLNFNYNENSPTNLKLSDAEEFNFVKDLGGDNTGIRDNSEILNNFLSMNSDPVTIYFTAGTYLFNNPIKLRSNVSLQGYSPLLTFFKFDLNGTNENLFKISGSRNTTTSYYKVVDASIKGSNKLILDNTNGLMPGDNIDLEQRNGDYMFYYDSFNQPWAEWSVGQMLRIQRIEGDTLYLDRTLTNNYDTGLDLRLSKVHLISNIILEKIHIEREDKGFGNNIFFYYAENCIVNCIISQYAPISHIRIERSRNISISGNLFYDASYHCGGGAGYGILIRKHATECLITNNIFRHLRHSIIIKEGANRNVISYNCSNNIKISDGNISQGPCYNARIVDAFADISVHGHYSYMNLFEGNVVQGIHSADNWGPSGPGTTFFRNKIESNYGLKVWMGSKGQNVIGNIIPDGKIQIDTSVHEIFIAKNISRNKINTDIVNILPKSLYLTDKPTFYSVMNWPSINPSNPVNPTNPANERMKNNKYFDQSCCGNFPGMNAIVTFANEIYVFYENGYLYSATLPEDVYSLKIFNMQGVCLYSSDSVDKSLQQHIGYLQTGLYIANYLGNGKIYKVKFVVQD